MPYHNAAHGPDVHRFAVHSVGAGSLVPLFIAGSGLVEASCQMCVPYLLKNISVKFPVKLCSAINAPLNNVQFTPQKRLLQVANFL